jgi:hypothetical protein
MVLNPIVMDAWGSRMAYWPAHDTSHDVFVVHVEVFRTNHLMVSNALDVLCSFLQEVCKSQFLKLAQLPTTFL